MGQKIHCAQTPIFPLPRITNSAFEDSNLSLATIMESSATTPTNSTNTGMFSIDSLLNKNSNLTSFSNPVSVNSTGMSGGAPPELQGKQVCSLKMPAAVIIFLICFILPSLLYY
jgi:hypothetical protein